MEEPQDKSKKIMKFEEQYTPQSTNLIKKSLIDNVSLEDGELNIDDDDHFPQLSASAHPTTKTSASDTNIISVSNQNEALHPAQSTVVLDPQSNSDNKPNLESQLLSSSQPSPKSMPSYEAKKRHNHRHKETPIMTRAASSKVAMKLSDQDSHPCMEDVEYNSNEDRSDSNDGENRDGFIVSHKTHKSKLKSRKLDRQTAMSKRNGTSVSDVIDFFVKIYDMIIVLFHNGYFCFIMAMIAVVCGQLFVGTTEPPTPSNDDWTEYVVWGGVALIGIIVIVFCCWRVFCSNRAPQLNNNVVAIDDDSGDNTSDDIDDYDAARDSAGEEKKDNVEMVNLEHVLQTEKGIIGAMVAKVDHHKKSTGSKSYTTYPAMPRLSQISHPRLMNGVVQLTDVGPSTGVTFYIVKTIHTELITNDHDLTLLDVYWALMWWATL